MAGWIARRAARRFRKAFLLFHRITRAGGWPPAPDGGSEGLRARLREATPRLEHVLADCMLPFWRQRVVDRTGGGFHLHHDAAGRDLGPTPKHIIAQARTLWFFSRVHDSVWRAPTDAVAARHGFEYLRAMMWDVRDGGFVWEVGADGHPLSPHKHALAQSYAIYALARFARAFNDGEALNLARRTFELYDDRAHDPVHGGYREMLRRDWSAADGLTGYWAADPDLKLLDTHLHLLEAFAALQSVCPDPLLERRVRELLEIVTTVDATQRQGVTRFHRDWTPIPKTRVEYGFDMKRVWMTEDAARIVGVDRTAVAELHHEVFDRAMTFGWDRRDGGLFNAGRPGCLADELVKTWWTQAEALVASAWMWRATGEARYAHVFLAMLDWIEGYQVDWAHGDWHEKVDHRRRPSGRKAWAWKSPYHVTRAVLESLRLLGDDSEALRAL